MSDGRIKGRRLQEIRRLHAMQDPLCVRCRAKGKYRAWTQLDHIVPLRARGGRGQDVPANRQGLCDACHAEKTAEDMGYKLKLKIGVDGYPVKR
jgi:5-methylcytosine-specific restriction endonuclease McrA